MFIHPQGIFHRVYQKPQGSKVPGPQGVENSTWKINPTSKNPQTWKTFPITRFRLKYVTAQIIYFSLRSDKLPNESPSFEFPFRKQLQCVVLLFSAGETSCFSYKFPRVDYLRSTPFPRGGWEFIIQFGKSLIGKTLIGLYVFEFFLFSFIFSIFSNNNFFNIFFLNHNFVNNFYSIMFFNIFLNIFFSFIKFRLNQFWFDFP